MTGYNRVKANELAEMWRSGQIACSVGEVVTQDSLSDRKGKEIYGSL